MDIIIDKIFSKLLVYIKEDGTILRKLDNDERNIIKSEFYHKDVFNQNVLGCKFLKGEYDLSNDMIINSMLLAQAGNKFLMFCNNTNYNKSDKCNKVIVQCSNELTENQLFILEYCKEKFEEYGVNVIVFAFDQVKEPIECSLDEFLKLQYDKSREKVYLKK